MYRDPFTAPLEFVRDGVMRFALLVADVVAGLPATYWTHGVIRPPAVLSSGMIPLTWLFDLTEPRRVFSAVALVCTAVRLLGRPMQRCAAQRRTAWRARAG